MKVCDKCGKELADRAKFCNNCGSSVSSSAEEASALNKEVLPDNKLQSKDENKPQIEKKLPKKTVKTIITVSVAVFTFLFVTIAAYIGISVVNSPKRVVEKYFYNISSGEYEKNFELIGTHDTYFSESDYSQDIINDFFSKQAYTKYCEKNYYIGSENYLYIQQVTEDFNMEYLLNPSTVVRYLQGYRKMQKYTYQVSYYNAVGDLETREFIVSQQNNNKLLIFKNYKIDPECIVAYNQYINVDSGFDVLVDDIDVSEYSTVETEYDIYGDEKGEYTQIYIPIAFEGNHIVSVENEVIGKIDETVYFCAEAESQDSYWGSEYDGKHEIRNFEYSAETVKAVNEQTYKISKEIIGLIGKGKNYKAMKSDLTQNLTESDFTAFTYELSFNKEKLPEITVSDKYSDIYSSSHSVLVNEFGEYRIYSEISVDCTIKYPPEKEGDKPTKKTKTLEIEIEYVYEDGEWVPVEVIDVDEDW